MLLTGEGSFILWVCERWNGCCIFCVCTYVRMYIRVDLVSSWAAENVLQIDNRETWTLLSKPPTPGSLILFLFVTSASCIATAVEGPPSP